MTKRFIFEGRIVALDAMLQDNAHDAAVCEWLRTAAVGDRFDEALQCIDPIDTEASLCAELEAWCKAQGLEFLSADDLRAVLTDSDPALRTKQTDEQIDWLGDYINRWDAVVG